MEQSSGARLLTWRFALLNAAYFCLCGTLAAFFGLDEHFSGLGMDRSSSGLLMGSVGLGALVARPFIAPFLMSRRACVVCLAASGLLLAGVLFAYIPARSFGELMATRLLNGAGYAGVYCAIVALSPYAFPASRSGAAFSILMISSLAPFIMLPPVLDEVSRLFGGYKYALAASGIPVLLILPALAFEFMRAKPDAGVEEPCASLKDSLRSLRRGDVAAVLFASFAFYFSYSCMFYFTKRVCTDHGIANPGSLLSVAIACSVVFRVIFAKALDKGSKGALLLGSLLLHSAGVAAMPLCDTFLEYLAVFVVFGVAWGAAVPLLFALVMELSPPSAQGFNLNMSSQMLDFGYFFGPMLGGMAMARSGPGLLFGVCAGVSLFGALCLWAGLWRPFRRVISSGRI